MKINFTFTRTFCVLVAISLIAVSGLAQRSKSRFDPDGSFWILGTPPNDFSDFGGINLNAKRLRRLPSPGLQLNNGRTFRFKALSVTRQRLSFTTVALGGVSYSFTGRFLKGGVFAEDTELNDETPVLEGTLTKNKAGQKIAEAKLKFVYFGGT